MGRAPTRHPPCRSPPEPSPSPSDPRVLKAAAPRLLAGRGPLHDVLLLAPLIVLYLLICAFAQPGPGAVRDEGDLVAAAARLLDGRLVPGGEVTDPRAYLWHGPGLVALLAPLVALDLPLTALRFVEPVFMSGAVLLFLRLVRLRLAPAPALAWTYAFGLYVPFFAVVPQLHKEPLSILVVVAGMLALTRGLAGGGRTALVGAGLCLAALTMVRLEYGWIAVALLAAALATWAVHRHSAVARRLVVVGAVAVAGCLPWLAYTHQLTGQAFYWGTSSGLSLFWMSPTLPGETGQWREPALVEQDPAIAAYGPLFRELAQLHPVESDRRLRELAGENIRERPLDYVRNLGANTTRLFFSVPMRPALTPFGIGVYVVCNTLLLAGVAWAAAVLWRERRRRAIAPETIPIALFAALAIAVHLPPSASPRMLLPVVPALLFLVIQAAACRRPAGRSGRGARERAARAPLAARRPQVVLHEHAGQGQ